MNNTIYGAYLEDYRLIKLIVPDYLGRNITSLCVMNDSTNILLTISELSIYGTEYHIYCTSSNDLIVNQEYQVIINHEVKFDLMLGKIIRTSRFDQENEYDGPLGFTYTEEATTFNLWSPVAKEIKLVINNDDKKAYPMIYDERGHWQKTIDQDLDGAIYYFLVRINKEFEKVLDPYGIATTANFNENVVIDWSKTYQMKNKRPKLSLKHYDYTIYELHLRDFSIQRMGNPQDSFYLELLKHPYLQKLHDLGVTHVQLMPVFGFGGIDEENKEILYNWGYNPIQYNVPTGWYASDVNNPYTRINELKMLIDGLHEKGFAATMDVVYNHTYKIGSCALAQLVPGYFFRTDSQGFLLDSSGCGNDFACEKKMAHRFVMDSVNMWFNNYLFDGFRFDLMGLLDLQLINNLENELHQLYRYAFIYGEGWKMPSNLLEIYQANVFNSSKMPDIAFFNDRFRDAIRGSSFNQSLGFTQGITNEKDLEGLLNGNLYPMLKPSQSINYFECHDNRTFFDQLAITLKNKNEVSDRLILGYGLLALSPGIVFIHSGGEAMRSKGGIENTYNLGDYVNQLDWQLWEKNTVVVKAIKDLLFIRKTYPVLRNSGNSKIIFINNHTISWIKDELLIFIKNDYEKYEIHLDSIKQLIFNGTSSTNTFVSSLVLDHPMVVIFKA